MFRPCHRPDTPKGQGHRGAVHVNAWRFSRTQGQTTPTSGAKTSRHPSLTQSGSVPVGRGLCSLMSLRNPADLDRN